MPFADTKAFLADFGVQAVKAEVPPDDSLGSVLQPALPFIAILSQPGRTIEFGGVPVVSQDWAIEYAAADVQLTEGDALTCQGRSFKVNEVTPSEDGVFNLAKLRKV